MDRYSNTLALVINRQTSRESDLYITLLTPSFGKIHASAKSATNIKSSRLSSLQLGNVIKVSLYQKDNHYWITETKTIAGFALLPKDFPQHQLLFFFLETLNQLLAENQIIPSLFELCCQALESINRHSYSQFLRYLVEIIELLGFGCPPEIKDYLKNNDYPSAHRQIFKLIESIIEKPLASRKLFQSLKSTTN